MREDYRIVKRTKAEAIAILKQRYAETCERYPLTRGYFSEAHYVRVNTRAAMKYAVPFCDCSPEMREGLVP